MAYRTSMGAKDRKRRRETLWKKQKGKCAICKIDLTLAEARLDHKTPRSKGGANNLKNTQVLCEICDTEKADK